MRDRAVAAISTSLSNLLSRCGCFALMQEVATAKLLGRQPNRGGDLIHVALKGKDALGRSEAAKGSMRRNGGRHGSGADSNVVAK